MHASRWWIAGCLGLIASAPARSPAAPHLATSAILPPEIPWDGRSKEFIAAAGDRWVTPAEASGLSQTPRYDATIAWLRRLCDAAPELEMLSIGRTAEGRDIWMVVATLAGGFTPEALRQTGQPILLAQAGIHAGEIDGKDAGMMLLRDLTVTGRKRDLLERAHFLFVPILNADGHERFSPHARINQRGPSECGWRTTARNLNLNRDYTKLEAPETRAIVSALNTWQPDLYLDLHVTDGADYQYDITWGYNGAKAHSPAIVKWFEESLDPKLAQALTKHGHIPGPLVFLLDNADPTRGNQVWNALPRFSNGYGDVRHLPTVLVENHSLKPYRQRVLGTYVLLESTLRTLGENAGALRAAVASDRARRPGTVPLEWRVSRRQAAPVKEFLGIESRLVSSAASGSRYPEYTGKRVTLRIPFLVTDDDSITAERPKAYWVPAAWPEIIAKLELHGIEMQRISSARELEVDVDRATKPELAREPFEGRVRVTATFVTERRKRSFPVGSVRVPTDQPLGDLAVILLDPRSPDSFFAWGFFPEVLQATEYVEDYILEPMADRMLAESFDLRSEFQKALRSDSILAGDPVARRQWLYERSPYFDAEWRVVPIARE